MTKHFKVCHIQGRFTLIRHAELLAEAAERRDVLHLLERQLRDLHARDRARLAAVLAGTGCEVLVADGGR